MTTASLVLLSAYLLYVLVDLIANMKRRLDVSTRGMVIIGLGSRQQVLWAQVEDLAVEPTKKGPRVSLRLSDSWIALPSGLALDGGERLPPEALLELLASYRQA